MVQHRCPHCGNDGISGLRKSFLGPLATTNCSSCGKAVSVPYWSMVALLPWFIAIFLVLAIPDRAFPGFWLGAISVMLTALIWQSFVPLVKR